MLDANARRADRCLAISTFIGERLATPASVRDFHEQAFALLDEDGHAPAFEPTSLFVGTTGTALLHAALFQATGEVRWRDRAREHLAYAARSFVERPTPPGLLGGVAGLLAAASYCGRTVGGYAKLRSQLAGFLAEGLKTTISTLTSRGSAEMSEHDLFDGVPGVCIALATEPIPEIPDVLTDFAEWMMADTTRWRTENPRSRLLINNIGLAHGVGGLLTALGAFPATAAGAKVTSKLIDWLAARSNIGSTPRWPHFVEPEDGSTPPEGRVAWCYGALGLAPALWNAGTRYGRRDAVSWSENALLGLGKLPRESWHTTGHAMCHGTAGIAMVADAMARTSALDLDSMFEAALEETIDAFDPGLALGYRDTVSSDRRIDIAGMGDGATGIALILLTCAGLADPSWTAYVGLPQGPPSMSPRGPSHEHMLMEPHEENTSTAAERR